MNPFDLIDNGRNAFNGNPFDALEGIGKHREPLMRLLEANPLFAQYAQHINNPNRSYNTQPWQALAERNYAAYMCLVAATVDKIKVHGIRTDLSRENTMVATAFLILSTTPYLWSDPMEKLADAAPLPKHVVSRTVMPCPTMFWSRESAYKGRDQVLDTMCENNWIALIYSGQKVTVIGDWFDLEREELTIMIQQVPFGKTWPHDYGEDREIGVVLKRCAFLSSPYVDTEKRKLAHHHRRQMERAHIPPPQREESIHVVKLRRKATTPAQHPQGEPNPVDWKHQWWVQAHYRAQWYPSEQSHKVIWIAPFLKGPAGLPVLEKSMRWLGEKPRQIKISNIF